MISSRVSPVLTAVISAVALLIPALCGAPSAEVSDTGRRFAVLQADAFARHVSTFNAMEDENRSNLIPNKDAWDWMKAQVPLFECSSSEVEEIYYFRWWSLRKHLRKDEAGRRVFTEFLTKQRTNSSALGHHLAELRWLRQQDAVDEYVMHWLRGNQGRPQTHLHKYSGWLPYALQQRAWVTGDTGFTISLLDDLVADYRQWELEKRRPDGLFWQHDVWDAMEESISGSRTKKNIRPTINSYQFGSASALADLARLAGRQELATEFDGKAAELRRLTQERLWDPQASFFKVVLEETGGFADVREEIGFIPWYFKLPEPGKGYEQAWLQFKDTQGFKAPFGLTTAERRHPKFRSHGTGTCEWDGAVWPYATSQTLTALANVLQDYPQTVVGREDYFDAFLTYVRSQRYYGLPYIGEYHDEQTGQWLKFRQERSRYYNHSTFADLLITGLVGLRPRSDDIVDVKPLLPPGTWTWFCIDGLRYRGHDLCILWDAKGERYGKGKGLVLFIDGKEAARSETLAPIQAKLPQRGYLFAYFLVAGDDGLHLAWSDDGLSFEEIVPGKSYLMPTIGDTTPKKIIRDPCLLQAVDGVFHLVWTTDWAGKNIGYARSKDLLDWSEQKLIPVMGHEPNAQNCWAPELAWDPEKEQYVIFWSTTILGLFPETENSNRKRERNHRIYSTTTKDFEHFAPTRLHYNGGFNVIDATLVPEGKGWLMFVKNETFAPKTEKNIHMIRCATIDGPFSEALPAITGAYWAEGPSALKKDGWWHVYFDKHMENKYGLVRSKDLQTWVDVSDRVRFPKDARHGTVLEVDRSVLELLKAAACRRP